MPQTLKVYLNMCKCLYISDSATVKSGSKSSSRAGGSGVPTPSSAGTGSK